MLEQFQPWMDYGKLIELQARQASFIGKPQEEKKNMVKNKPYLQNKYPTSRVGNLKIGRR